MTEFAHETVILSVEDRNKIARSFIICVLEMDEKTAEDFTKEDRGAIERVTSCDERIANLRKDISNFWKRVEEEVPQAPVFASQKGSIWGAVNFIMQMETHHQDGNASSISSLLSIR